MKHAFTLVELIIIVIIIGIIAVTASTSFYKDRLTPATNQLLEHIRYTQQLALNQDMFIPSPYFSIYSDTTQALKDSKQWFKKWWRIQFHNNGSYSVYSDHPTKGSSNQYDSDVDDNDLVAKDPLTGLYLFGNLSGSSIYEGDERLGLVDMQKVYGVTVSINSACTGAHILFDHMGRPHCKKSAKGVNVDSLNPYDRIVRDFIAITLTKEDGSSSKTICVTPISGYAYITEKNGCP